MAHVQSNGNSIMAVEPPDRVRMKPYVQNALSYNPGNSWEADPKKATAQSRFESLGSGQFPEDPFDQAEHKQQRTAQGQAPHREKAKQSGNCKVIGSSRMSFR